MALSWRDGCLKNANRFILKPNLKKIWIECYWILIGIVRHFYPLITGLISAVNFGRFGSLAAPRDSTIPMAAIGGKADIELPIGGHKKPGT